MKLAIEAIVTELQRLKANGVQRVPVRAESVLALARAVRSRKPAPAPDPQTSPQPAESSPLPTRSRAEDVPVPPQRPDPRSAAARPLVPREPREPDFPSPTPFTLPAGDKQTRWNWLRDHVFADPVCQGQLRRGKRLVFGAGSLDASIFFVGEAPGAEEELQGEPFVGPAGQLLTRMIQAMGLSRDSVYIGNIMNWRPQIPTIAGEEQVGNRPPTAAEMAYCLPYLKAQVEIVAPKLIVALGKTAVDGLLGQDRFKTLSEAKGRWFDYSGVPLMVTYHPSYLLRNQSNAAKRAAWEDLLKVMERAELPISDKQRAFFQNRS